MQDFHRSGENRDSTLGGYRQNLVYTKTQGKGAVAPQETEPDLPASVGGSLAEAWVHSSSLAEAVSYTMSPLIGYHSPYHRVFRLLGWVTSGQTTNWEGSIAPPISRQLYSSFTEHSPAHQTKTQFSPQPVPPIRKLISSVQFSSVQSLSRV